MFSSLLLSWYGRHKRRLPWRRTRDPYRILMSEFMLQQTQVSRVLLFYQAWLKRFSTFKDLAAASNADVLRVWAGLGYNRRALMVRDVARAVMKKNPSLTSPLSAQTFWRSFKGIGPYTAAAIALFAYHERVLPIDTNIRRVLDRVFLGIAFPDPKKDELLLKKRDVILPKHEPYWNVPQALFDLANAVCTKKPDCVSCPLRSVCKTADIFLTGRVAIPKTMKKSTKERIHNGKKYPDRIYRGRILALVRASSTVRIAVIGKRIDPSYHPVKDKAWLMAMLYRMEKDGMIVKKGKEIQLA